ncbi:hypothetical protein AHiyo1_39440 [Arthrobacter sp. Hiyo1]|nr:hypothetical protein AHiyo1_39440 [Arthrobacter sp. Hiyo1]
MILPDEPFAVREDHLGTLHGGTRRQAAVVLAERHGPAGEGRAHAEFTHDADLDVDRVLKSRGEEVVVVGCRGAAGKQEFRERYLHGKLEAVRSEARPYGIEVLQPREQGSVCYRAPGPREGLVEVVMRVDEPGQQDVAAGVESFMARRGRALSCGDELGDFPIADHDAAAGVEAVCGEHIEGILDPEPGSGRVCCGGCWLEIGCRGHGDPCLVGVVAFQLSGSCLLIQVPEVNPAGGTQRKWLPEMRQCDRREIRAAARR